MNLFTSFDQSKKKYLKSLDQLAFVIKVKKMVYWHKQGDQSDLVRQTLLAEFKTCEVSEGVSSDVDADPVLAT